ncbi:GPI mannosyltransferase [Lachnellula hyalina]|uniref:GPI mannosyltransferase 2 n=1 Tax=Lachnellula hyalina TaxID=1316788 RepID=A0A8H8R4Z8_9HELO|nr:GPI mannosyltransferase [Lachnellula hyalina]TVY27600.1 GPI mannosyltransferase [Lachnellula hyalina]
MQLWARSRPFDNPIRSLAALFVVWKCLILVIACCSPGPGYDTSTSLLLPTHESGEGRNLPTIVQHLVGRLTRWDAFYYVKAASRGYLFEQEWAFGWGFTRIIALGTTGLEKIGIAHYDGVEAVVAICIAHFAHFLSVLLLFNLTLAVFPGSTTRFAFTTSALYIISPAGIFLSAPYAESSCALFAFAGCLAFAKSFTSEQPSTTAKHDLLLLGSGVLFGMSVTLRSNGLLNGLLLLEEAFRVLLSLKNDFQIARVRRLIASGLGGLSVASGFLLPQYISYSDFCREEGVAILRPWCTKPLPSIYTFVQEHYWNVGLFRYWTLSNLPLFMLAAPMLVMMTVSGVWGLSSNRQVQHATNKLPKRAEGFPILRNLATSQLLFTLITFTTAHVQIITRTSSAFPVWLWYSIMSSEKGNSLVRNMAKFMVMYVVIQGGLFASFLPPA